MSKSFIKKKKEEIVIDHRNDVPIEQVSPEIGLTSDQVAVRMSGGWDNKPVEPPGKTTKQIIYDNVFTYFNLLFFILAIAVCFVRQWLNLTFMGVIFWNTIIGIIQELKAKKTLDKLSILASPKAMVIRDRSKQEIEASKTVRDDIAIFASGNQIYADAVVVSGECHVNEALITGESDEILKKPGDKLLSGSFVINGVCRARLTEVGSDSFVSKLTIEAKKAQEPSESEMMRALTSLIKWIGIIVIPLGLIMLLKEYCWLGRNIATSVTSTVGSIIGMIPEGLYLLTSIALAAGVVRLATKKTLVHDMGCIETLARVDTLCVDKTGTITENKMTVEDIVPLDESTWTDSDIRLIMSDYVFAMQADNDTMVALKKYFTGEARQKAVKVMPFTSAKKYGGATFEDGNTFLLGAPEIITASKIDESVKDEIDRCSSTGSRVLLLAKYSGSLDDDIINESEPVSLILLANKIRDEAPATFKYFSEQGVEVKVISGDNPATVSEVAKRAGIQNAERFVDARTLTDDELLKKAAGEYVVFGRVVPEQKKKLVIALKEQGHTVAMTGDGVNDVLALKEADCSVAMASGSDVASQVSQIVLLDSNFASMPSVVAEGRRVINNIERSASLYLVKNIFTFILAFITLIFTLPYPYSPAQLSLVNVFAIGIPSFVFALEPNESLVKGRFLSNVIFRAIPAALTDVTLVIGVMLFYLAFGFDDSVLSTVSTGIMAIVGLMLIFKISKPFNWLRILTFIVCVLGYSICYLFFPTWFTLNALNGSGFLVLVVLGLLAWPLLNLYERAIGNIRGSLENRKLNKDNKK